MTLRVCLVDRSEDEPAYALIEETGVHVRARIPRLAMCPPDMARDYDVVLVGASSADVERATWRDAVRAIAAVCPVVAAVDAGDIERVVLAAPSMQLRGCAARAISPEAMRRTLEAVVRGETAFPRGAVGLLLGAETVPHPPPMRRSGLTPRQREIVELIAEGATDREVAVALHISEATAHKHVQNALRRVGARSRSHLVARTRSRSA